MRRYALVILMVAVGAGMTLAAPTSKPSDTPKSAPRKGEEKNATVSGVEAHKGELGIVLALTVKKEKGGTLTFYVSPRNATAYGTTGGLKMNDKVNLTWGMEGTSEKKWVSSIQVLPKDKPKGSTPSIK